MSDEAAQIESTVRPYARKVANALKEEARSAGHKDGNSLIRGMNGRIRKDGADVWGISIKMKRYGYILHHGIKAQTIQRSSGNYSHPGIKGSEFITKALDKHMDSLANDLQKVSGDMSLNRMNF